MNKQFDLIVIGDSKQGHDVIKHVAGTKRTIKTAFISTAFKTKTTRDFLNVEYIKDEVVIIDYKNRLFGCYLKGGARLFCTHLVIATGLNYAPLVINNKTMPNVFNTTDEITKLAKNMQAVVIGNNDSDVKFALSVAKKYKYVYFCTEAFTTNITSANMKKLSDTENLVVLPNASITKFSTTDGTLSSIELSNYSTLTCSAVFAKTPAKPATSFLPNNIMVKDCDGYLLTSTTLESTIIPKCYATGNCTRKSTKQMNLAMYESILNDF